MLKIIPFLIDILLSIALFVIIGLVKDRLKKHPDDQLETHEAFLTHAMYAIVGIVIALSVLMLLQIFL